MVILPSKIQARTLAPIAGMGETFLIRGVLGTGVAAAGSNGTEVRGVAMVLTEDGDVTGTDADVISQAGQTGIIIGRCRFWKQEQSSPGFGVSI